MSELEDDLINKLSEAEDKINTQLLSVDISNPNYMSQDKIDLIATNITNIFNEEIELIEQLNSRYNDNLIIDNNLNELYNMYQDQNTDLDSNIKTHHSDVLTNDRKTYYESTALETLVNWNTFFLYLYFTLLFAFVLGIFLSPIRIPKYQTIVIAIILFLYPFLIDPIVSLFNKFFNKIAALYPKNVYNSL